MPLNSRIFHLKDIISPGPRGHVHLPPRAGFMMVPLTEKFIKYIEGGQNL